MSRLPEAVFVDTGAWIALAVVPDPFHERARSAWEELRRSGAKLHTSVPVAIETFTYLDRKGSRELARSWRESLDDLTGLTLLECDGRKLAEAWREADRPGFHRLGIVDATSFVLMRAHKIRAAFAFDSHFAVAGFRCIG